MQGCQAHAGASGSASPFKRVDDHSSYSRSGMPSALRAQQHLRSRAPFMGFTSGYEPDSKSQPSSEHAPHKDIMGKHYGNE